MKAAPTKGGFDGKVSLSSPPQWSVSKHFLSKPFFVVPESIIICRERVGGEGEGSFKDRAKLSLTLKCLGKLIITKVRNIVGCREA